MNETPLSSDVATKPSGSRALRAVHGVSRLLSSTLDLDARVRAILSVSLEAVDAEAGSVLLHRAEDGALVFQYVVGSKAGELTGYEMPAGRGLAGAVFRSGLPEITNDPHAARAHEGGIDASIGYTTRSIVTVPLQYQEGHPVGVMQVLNKRGGPFTGDDLTTLEIIAAIAAAAIENAHLHREAELAAVAHAVGDLSHDIKNKVTPISLGVQTLAPFLADTFQDVHIAAANLPDAARVPLLRSVESAREFATETFEIIRDQVEEIQDYTKLIADALKGVIAEPQMERQDLATVVDRQVDSLATVADKRSVRLLKEYNDVPPFPFDRFLVERAVYNLVNNALPETPQGGTVTVKISAENSFAVVEVADTGRGMPPSVLDRILHGNAQSTKPGGTGLGTRIVFNAVRAHNGLFEGESEEAHGTTFRLKLPMGDA